MIAAAGHGNIKPLGLVAGFHVADCLLGRALIVLLGNALDLRWSRHQQQTLMANAAIALVAHKIQCAAEVSLYHRGITIFLAGRNQIRSWLAAVLKTNLL